MCIYAQPQADAEYSWHEAAGLPLPGIITRSGHCTEVSVSQRMDESWNVVPIEDNERRVHEFSVMGEVLKLLGVW